MTLVPWDSPLRVRRLDYETKQEISDAEWNEWNWYNVTSKTDPQDAHVWVKTWRREPIQGDQPK